jgi:hypothetical protein
MQLNERSEKGASLKKHRIVKRDQEEPMTELLDVRAKSAEQPAVGVTAKAFQADLRTMTILFGAQRLLLDEMVFVSNEILDRARTEGHLFTEFASKVAQAHSVNNIKAMWEECGQHQIDVIRRDSDRLFKHGQRIMDNMSNLLKGRLVN